MILTVFLLNILCSALFFGNSSSSIYVGVVPNDFSTAIRLWRASRLCCNPCRFGWRGGLLFYIRCHLGLSNCRCGFGEWFFIIWNLGEAFVVGFWNVLSNLWWMVWSLVNIKRGLFDFVYGIYFALVKSRVTSRKVTNCKFVTDLWLTPVFSWKHLRALKL